MKNKIIIVALLVAAISITSYFLYSTRSIYKQPQASSQSDRILIRKGITQTDAKTYEVDIATKKITPYYGILSGDFSKFSGLPQEKETTTTITSIYSTLYSHDRSKVLLTFFTYDKTQPSEAVEGFFPVIHEEEFLCDADSKKCYQSNLLSTTGTKEPNIWWFEWDSEENLLFGHPSGPGLGDSSPVVIYDTDKGISRTTVGYDARKGHEKRANVPVGTFSPSLKQFFMVYESSPHETSISHYATKFDFLLYNTRGLSNPSKTFTFNASTLKADYISGMAWSPDEEKIAIGTDRGIYVLDIRSGKLSLVYAGEHPILLIFSPGGKHIAFIEFTDDLRVLKIVDLGGANKVIEIARDEYLEFPQQP